MRLPALALALASLASPLLACSHASQPADAAAPARVLPPPARPADLVLEGHFAHPRATVATLSRMSGVRIPFELGLALALGIDSSVLAAADTAQPIDVAITAGEHSPELVIVLTPATPGQLRSTLSGRYRFVTEPDLGDRLEPRQGAASTDATRCALVGVPGPISTRIVCASRLVALEHAGRYAAYQAGAHASDTDDALIDVDGATARRTVVPALRTWLEGYASDLSRMAAEERRNHPRPPDYGDPEALITVLNDFAHSLDAQSADVQHLRLHATIVPEQASLESELTLDAAGHSGLVRDALSRLSVPAEHPLASLLAPDALAAFTTRATPGERVALLSEIIDAAVRTMGTRLPDADTARTELHGLFAHVGDEMAASVSRDAHGTPEIVLLFSQDDHGAAARDAVTRWARAPWLRGLRVGGAPVTLIARNGVLIVRPHETAPPASAPRGHTAPDARPAPPPSVALGLAGENLAIVIGSTPDTTLAALAPRAGGPLPALLAHAPEGSAIGAIDAGALAGNAGESAPVYTRYRVTREGTALIGHAAVTVPIAAINAIRQAARARNAPPPSLSAPTLPR